LQQKFDEFLPDGDVGVVSDEGVRQVMLLGHVAVVTQVKVMTSGALPANATQSVHTTYVTRDAFVTYT